jgi:hypothetical protein
VRWIGRRSRVASDRVAGEVDRDDWDARLRYAEDDDALARLAERRGWEAGAVRLSRDEAIGADVPAEREIQALGRLRQAFARRRGAEAENGPRRRVANADDREERARQRQAVLSERLGQLRDEVRPARADALHEAQRELGDLDRAYRNLSLVERGVPGLRLPFVEAVAVTVAGFDAFFMKLPLERAGILEIATQRALIAGVAFVIFGSIHACGTYGGMLSLRLSTRDRRQLATFVIAAILFLVVAGFVLLAVLRHLWTVQVDHAIDHGDGTRRHLIDLTFLMPLQIAGALAAAALLAVYQMGAPGRSMHRDIAVARARFDTREGELRATHEDIFERVPRAIERAALEVYDVRVDKADAEVELTSIQASTAARVDEEEHRTDAAVDRYRVEYEVTERKFANGGSRYARHPDGFLRHWRRWVVDDDPTPSDPDGRR